MGLLSFFEDLGICFLFWCVFFGFVRRLQVLRRRYQFRIVF